MNQEKIGKFIALCRKNHNLTQLELAEKLGITDRSISKWENGKCMPDVSLFQPLCKELDITLNELLSGEVLEAKCYQKKSEENMMQTLIYTDQKAKEKRKIIGTILLVFGFFITLTAIAIFPSESSWSSIYSVLGVIISLVGFSRLTKKTDYMYRVVFHFLFFIGFIFILFILDFGNVMLNHQAPRFSLRTTTIDQTIYYDTPFYDVVRCNKNEKNETYQVINNKKYTIDIIIQSCKQ